MILFHQKSLGLVSPQFVSRLGVHLLAVGAALGEAAATASRLAQGSGAGRAEDDNLGMAEDRCNVEAPWALHVHEERIGALHKAFKLMTTAFLFVGRVQKVGATLSHDVRLETSHDTAGLTAP